MIVNKALELSSYYIIYFFQYLVSYINHSNEEDFREFVENVRNSKIYNFEYQHNELNW